MKKKVDLLLSKGIIGLKTRIIDSSNKNAVGISGRIIDETRNMITIEMSGTQKRLIKNQHTFELSIEDALIRIEGKNLVGRPEERIKKW